MVIQEIKDRFTIPAKKKIVKSKWCNGFIVASAATDMDKVEKDRMEKIFDYRHRIMKQRM